MTDMKDGLGFDALTAWLARFEFLLGDRTGSDGSLAKGMTEVLHHLETHPPAATVEELFKSVGMTLVSSAGSTIGPLYGTFFLRFGIAAGAVSQLDASSLGSALRAGLDGVAARGAAHLGGPAMLQTLVPALEAYDEAVAAGLDAGRAVAVAAGATTPDDNAAALLIEALAFVLTAD